MKTMSKESRKHNYDTHVEEILNYLQDKFNSLTDSKKHEETLQLIAQIRFQELLSKTRLNTCYFGN
jgi:hypothetical protein